MNSRTVAAAGGALLAGTFLLAVAFLAASPSAAAQLGHGTLVFEPVPLPDGGSAALPQIPRRESGILPLAEDEHARALQELERLWRHTRMNAGLRAEEQLPLVEGIIDRLVALGNWERADEMHEALLDLNRDIHGAGSPQTAAALLRLARWNMGRFHRALDSGGEAAPAPRSASREEAFAYLGKAQDHYVAGITLLIKTGAFTHPVLPEMERGLIEVYFLLSRRERLLEDPHAPFAPENPSLTAAGPGELHRMQRKTASFRGGLDAYRRLFGYLEKNPAAGVEDYAATLVGLGDWYTLFGHRREAREQYALARRLLEASELPAEEVQSLLHPAVPVVLPAITPAPGFASAPEASASHLEQERGYIDLAFSLNRHGRAAEVSVLGRSVNTSAEVERRLLSLVTGSQFRPLFSGDDPAREAVTLRYYFRSPGRARWP